MRLLLGDAVEINSKLYITYSYTIPPRLENKIAMFIFLCAYKFVAQTKINITGQLPGWVDIVGYTPPWSSTDRRRFLRRSVFFQSAKSSPDQINNCWSQYQTSTTLRDCEARQRSSLNATRAVIAPTTLHSWVVWVPLYNTSASIISVKR